MRYSLAEDRERRVTGTTEASQEPLYESARRLDQELSSKGINPASKEAEEIRQTGASAVQATGEPCGHA